MNAPTTQSLLDITIHQVQTDTADALKLIEKHRDEIARFEKFIQVLRDSGLDVTTYVSPGVTRVFYYIRSKFIEHSREAINTIHALGCKQIDACVDDHEERITFAGTDTIPSFSLIIYALDEEAVPA